MTELSIHQVSRQSVSNTGVVGKSGAQVKTGLFYTFQEYGFAFKEGGWELVFVVELYAEVYASGTDTSQSSRLAKEHPDCFDHETPSTGLLCL